LGLSCENVYVIVYMSVKALLEESKTANPLRQARVGANSIGNRERQ